MTQTSDDRVAVLDERDRCAFAAENLARRWRASAEKLRQRGMTRFLLIGKPYVAPSYERAARDIEAAAAGLDAVAYIIRRGLDLPERKAGEHHGSKPQEPGTPGEH